MNKLPDILINSSRQEQPSHYFFVVYLHGSLILIQHYSLILLQLVGLILEQHGKLIFEKT